jgi:hypothetical protein
VHRAYDTVHRAVDQLSDDGFPVERLDIVGRDLQLVERVTGRLTSARAAAAGAISGLWAGLLIGALLALFTTGHAWLGVVAVAAGFGALWGAVFGFAAHAARRGRHDFSSVRALTAARYDLVARDGTVDQLAPCSWAPDCCLLRRRARPTPAITTESHPAARKGQQKLSEFPAAKRRRRKAGGRRITHQNGGVMTRI